MKKALITGSTSYLGLALTERLMAEGAEVHAVLRPSTDTKHFDRLPGAPAMHIHDGETDSLARILAEAAPDVVFHLAGRYLRDVEPDQLEPLLRDNIVFGTQLLAAMRRAGAGLLVNAGTYAQYFHSDTYRPLNLYAATKQAFEDILAYYAEVGGLLATTLVLFDSYGPGDWRGKLVSAIGQAQMNGEPLALPSADVHLDLLHIDDVVAAFVQAGRLLEESPDEVKGRVFAVSLGETHTIEELVTIFEEEAGTPVTRDWGAFPLPGRRVIKPWRGPSLPGWKPKVSLREGIRRTLAERG